MLIIKFDNYEVKEFTTDVPVVFNHPRKMIVWYDDDLMSYSVKVYAYLPDNADKPVKAADYDWDHCGEIS